MLVLTRKVGEEIIIGGDIRITITEIGNGRVKVGVTAPREMNVRRSELEAKPTVTEDLMQVLDARRQVLDRHLPKQRSRRDILESPRPR